MGGGVVYNLPVSLPRGSAWANTASQYTQAILLFLFVWWKKIHVQTWGGTLQSLTLQQTSAWPWGFGTVTSTRAVGLMKGLPSPHSGRGCSRDLRPLTAAPSHSVVGYCL